MLISTASDDREILVTQVLIGKQKLRIINAYGPQENELKEKIFAFWEQFESEIINAKENECFVLIEMDANAKLGAGWIVNDPHEISDNGILLRDILVRQNLACLNAREGCAGTITRHRRTVIGDEKSVLDYVIVCDQLLQYFQRMVIDEARVNVLTKYATKTGTRVKSESDHNPVFAEFNLTFSRCQTATRREIFDFRKRNLKESFLMLQIIQLS